MHSHRVAPTPGPRGASLRCRFEPRDEPPWTLAMIRIAIAGAGAIPERAHIPARRSVADAQIVAIQSRTADKAERVARTLWPDDAGRPKVYSDFDEMVARERPDA